MSDWRYEYRVFYREKGNVNAPQLEWMIRGVSKLHAKTMVKSELAKLTKKTGIKYTIIDVIDWN